MSGSKQRCKDLLGALSDYLDGDADERLCAEIERHMADCPDCRVLVDTLRKTIILYREREAGEGLPSDVQTRLYRRLNLEDLLPGT